ncbi:MAG: FAD-dependent oxidoreductase [Aquihabitans sp.]
MTKLSRVVIIGGVAGGMSAATRLRRLDPEVEIIVLERTGYVSFANCGLPYYIGGVIEREALTRRTPEGFRESAQIDVRVHHEVTSIDRSAHTVTVRRTDDDQEETLGYDKLLIATGAAPVRPPIPGYDRALTLRTVEDAERMNAAVDAKPAQAVVIGGGFIGLEVAENLVLRGIPVTVVEGAPQVMPPLDPEMAIMVADELDAHGVTLMLGTPVESIEDTTVTLKDGRVLPAELVIGSIGVKPDMHLARDAGIEIGPTGGIAVDDGHQTSDPDIFAVGDVAEKTDAVTGEPVLIALAHVANRHGRRVADHIAGQTTRPVPTQGTAIVKVFDLAAASVGWSERRLRDAGRRFQSIHIHPADHAGYYPGATMMSAKLLFDPDDGTILGAQIVGPNGVDKRIDVIATAMAGGFTAAQLADLELAYAPPYGSAKDAVNMLGYVAEGALEEGETSVDASDLAGLLADGWTLLDVRDPGDIEKFGAIDGHINVPVNEIRDRLDELAPGPVVAYCNVGQQSDGAAATLRDHGIEARNVDGGLKTWKATMRAETAYRQGS